METTFMEQSNSLNMDRRYPWNPLNVEMREWNPLNKDKRSPLM
jgi:hypothetical protein